MENSALCQHCRLASCPVLNKDECPINQLWRQAAEADQATVELVAEAERLVSVS